MPLGVPWTSQDLDRFLLLASSLPGACARTPRHPALSMSLIALQVGQAGCQGGAAFSDALAAEALGAGASSQQPDEQWSEAADRFFYLASSNGRTRWDGTPRGTDARPAPCPPSP